MELSEAWEAEAERWIEWARAPGHDAYWRFHRDQFLELVPPPGPLRVDLGCGEGRLARDLAGLGHRVVAIDGSFDRRCAAWRDRVAPDDVKAEGRRSADRYAAAFRAP